MTTHQGKPYSGNPHVRFDEGKVASEMPRRGSLLYKSMRSKLFVFAVLLTAGAAFAEPVVATADEAIAVDVRADVCNAVGSADVGYSPSWGGVTNAGAYVVLQKVVKSVTNDVATFAADAESSYSYTPVDGDGRFVRFIHHVYSSSDVEIGEPLVRDVAFGYRSAEGAAFVADSRTNSLQLAVDSKTPVNLAYSTAWATNAASVVLRAVQLSGRGGTETATNDVFSAAADAEGDTLLRGAGRGWWRLLCQIKDEQDGTLLEYLTDEFKMPSGFVLSVR